MFGSAIARHARPAVSREVVMTLNAQYVIELVARTKCTFHAKPYRF